MDILDCMGVSKLSAKVFFFFFFKVNYSFKANIIFEKYTLHQSCSHRLKDPYGQVHSSGFL